VRWPELAWLRYVTALIGVYSCNSIVLTRSTRTACALRSRWREGTRSELCPSTSESATIAQRIVAT